MPFTSKLRAFLTKPVNRIESVVITVVLVPLLAAAVTSAATTISTDITTGGNLSVTGTASIGSGADLGALLQVGSDPYLLIDTDSMNYSLGDSSGAMNNTFINVDDNDGVVEVNGNLTVTGTTNGVKVYRALLTQTGTNAPVATVLENSLGGTPVWTRIETGYYKATLAGGFPWGGKVFIQTPPWRDFMWGNTSFAFSGLYDVDEVRVMSTRASAPNTPADDTLVGAPIEILVYP